MSLKQTRWHSFTQRTVEGDSTSRFRRGLDILLVCSFMYGFYDDEAGLCVLWGPEKHGIVGRRWTGSGVLSMMSISFCWGRRQTLALDPWLRRLAQPKTGTLGRGAILRPHSANRQAGARLSQSLNSFLKMRFPASVTWAETSQSQQLKLHLPQMFVWGTWFYSSWFTSRLYY